MPVSRLALSPGVLIATKYELVSLLGAGAMGEVWKARHVSLHEDVAVKLVGWTEDHRDGAELASRFHLEARLAAGLSRKSRHIVSVTDHGIEQDAKTGESIAYLVMEQLIGEPLDVRLERTGPMALFDVAAIVTQIARGLSTAHAEGVIHRDLKPSNIFLTRGADGEEDLVKILDFGIAKFRGGGERAQAIQHQTQRGLLLGTLPYVSPEQARGWASLDHRADVWSLAVIAYLLLTNEYPFSGKTPSDLLARIFSGQYVPVQERRELPPIFADLFARAFHRHLDMRFQTATDFANALALATETTATPSRVSSADHEHDEHDELRLPAPRPERRRRRWWLLGGAVVLLVAGSSAALVRAVARPPAEAAQISPPPLPSATSTFVETTEPGAAATAGPAPGHALVDPMSTAASSAEHVSAEPTSVDPMSSAAPASTRGPRRPAPMRKRPADRSEIF